MAYYLKNRMLEIKEFLGPLLKELDLKTKTSTNKDSIVIEFVPRKEGGNFSPVAIVFDNRPITGLEEASWQHAHLLVEDWRRTVLGETGWSSWSRFGKFREDIKFDGHRMFQWLEFVIDYRGVVPDFGDMPGVLNNPRVADAYQVLVDWAEDLRIDRDESNSVETLLFTDSRGCDVRMTFRCFESHADVYVDDELLESVSQTNATRITEIGRKLGSYTGSSLSRG